MAGARADAPAAAAGEAGEAGGNPPSRDWTLRLFEASPLAPVWTGLGVVAVYLLAALLFRAVSAARPDAISPLPWVWELAGGLSVALPLTLNAYARRGALADLRELRGSLDLSEAGFAQLCAATTSASAGWLAVASSASVAVMLLVVLFDPSIWGEVPRPGPREPLLWWALLHNAAGAYAFGRMLALETALTAGYARIARLVRIDLLDQEPLAPLARKGQRSALLWILVSSSISLFFLGGRPTVINGFVLALILGLVATAFTLPLARVRARIAAGKRSELLRVNRLLERELDAVRSGGGSGGGRLADLVAWRGLVEGVREWPVGVPTLVRSGLFVLLGIGSWLGGAVVERLLEAALPR
jgi:hypothetical protein